MLGLFAPRIEKNIINIGDNVLSCFIKALTNRVLVYALTFGLAVCQPGVSKSATLPEIQNTLQPVCVNLARADGIRGWVFSFFQQDIPNWLCNIVELLSPVTPEGESMPEEQAKKESEKAEQVWLHLVLYPAIWFLAGFWASGGFSGLHRKKPNVEVEAPCAASRARSPRT